MERLTLLILVALTLPVLWGWFVHWLVSRLWPPERRRAVHWAEPPGDAPTSDFLDYQI
jgi:hypothetical protein